MAKTFLEAARELPSFSGDEAIIISRCPSFYFGQYGHNDSCLNTEITCKACWNREMPERS